MTISKEIKAEIIKMHNENVYYKDIINKFNIPVSTYFYITKNNKNIPNDTKNKEIITNYIKNIEIIPNNENLLKNYCKLEKLNRN